MMLAGLPLWFGPGGYTGLTASKFWFITVVTMCWIIATVIAAAHTRTGFRMTADKWVMILLLAVAAVSAVLSPYPEHVWMGSGRYNGLLSLLLYGIIYLGVSAYGRPGNAHLAVFILALAICSIVGILQLLGYNPLSLYPGDWNYYDKGIRYSGEFLGNVGNVDLYGALLCIGIPAALAVSLYGTGKIARWILLPAFLCLFIGFHMDVKATLLGLLAGFLLMTVQAVRRRRDLDHRRLLLVLFTVLLAGCLGFLIRFGEGEIHVAVRETEETVTAGEPSELERILRGEWSDDMGSSRIGIWRRLLATVPEHLWIGTGPGTVADRADMVFERYVPETGQTLRARVDNAHNEFLEYLVCEGIFGLVLYLLLMILTIVRLCRGQDRRALLFLPGLTAYWIQSFFGLGRILVLPAVFVFWGLAMSPSEQEEHQ